MSAWDLLLRFAMVSFIAMIIAFFGPGLTTQRDEASALDKALRCQSDHGPVCLWGGDRISSEQYGEAEADYLEACKSGEMIVRPATRFRGVSSVVVSCAGTSPAAEHLIELEYLFRLNTIFGEISFRPNAYSWWRTCPEECDGRRESFRVPSNN